MAGNVDKMLKADLMKYAASLGVATRREGGQMRKVEGVRADCKVREAAEQQRSASPSQAAPVAPSIDEAVSELGGLRRDDLRARAQSPTPADPRRSS